MGNMQVLWVIPILPT